MQQEEKEKIKKITREIIKEIIKEEIFSKSMKINDLEENKETETIRIFKVTKERLKEHCKNIVATPSQLASIAIEEKIKRDHSK